MCKAVSPAVLRTCTSARASNKARVTVREPSGVVQVVITDPRGKRYRPYLGEDRDVADRIAAAWGSHRGYSATVEQITPAATA